MNRFRTTEISGPKFESNNLRFITVKSTNLKGRGDICVYVPKVSTDNKLSDLPLIILLHGVYGSAWMWSQKAGVHLTAQAMINCGEIEPAVIAMPSDGLWGDGSAYLNQNELNFENWIASDVPDAVIENIPEVSKKSDLFISGLSMGGFGALRIGAKYPQKFKAISAHSSITDLSQMKLFVEEKIWETHPHKALLEIFKENKKQLPRIRFDCGTEDLLIEQNRTFRKELIRNNIEHVYEEFSGDHSWPYWEEHIKDSLKFFIKTT